MTEIGSEQAFDDIVQKTDKLVVVDFATTWCGPCKVMEPKMNQISEEYTDAEFYNCLLYPSPSPRDRTRSRMPSSA